MKQNGLGESQQRILEHLKRRGSSAVPSIAEELALNIETVRAHLKALGSDGWTRRVGTRRTGPGRPEILFGLTPTAEALFPNRESQLLGELTSFLVERGEEEVLDRFFDEYAEERLARALERLHGMEGEERLEEVARILTEDGFMAELRTSEDGRRQLSLCHCPLRGLVDVTSAPCRVEMRYVRELLGEELARVSYIPAGDAACSYTLGAEA